MEAFRTRKNSMLGSGFGFGGDKNYKLAEVSWENLSSKDDKISESERKGAEGRI